ncbi:GNAT family N-acetyltransferase [uncultured Sphingomonas sp.]|uniref:GNAT family N-acetyltransferase n=1 Tax=uncultured Sphingomonas sp. TaxID=158754 RepID=UPI0035CC2DDC
MQHIPLAQIDPAEVERLLDRAFGPDRHTRTAYKVRGTALALPDLSFAAVADRVLVGTVQCWPVALLGDDGAAYPLVMVGPVAVDPAHQRGGIGRALMTRALTAAGLSGADRALALIGDPEYYGRFFGFTTDRTARWRLPGPVEPRRLLARGPAVPDIPGMLGSRPALDARAAAA